MSTSPKSVRPQSRTERSRKNREERKERWVEATGFGVVQMGGMVLAGKAPARTKHICCLVSGNQRGPQKRNKQKWKKQKQKRGANSREVVTGQYWSLQPSPIWWFGLVWSSGCAHLRLQKGLGFKPTNHQLGATIITFAIVPWQNIRQCPLTTTNYGKKRRKTKSKRNKHIFGVGGIGATMSSPQAEPGLLPSRRLEDAAHLPGVRLI